MTKPKQNSRITTIEEGVGDELGHSEHFKHLPLQQPADQRVQGHQHPVQMLNKTTEPISTSDGGTPSMKIKMEKGARGGGGGGNLNEGI